MRHLEHPAPVDHEAWVRAQERLRRVELLRREYGGQMNERGHRLLAHTGFSAYVQVRSMNVNVEGAA